MCVILTKEPGQIIKPDVLEACYRVNHDGFGIAWHNGKEVRIHKGMKTIDSIQAITKALQQYRAIIHFRFATHGDKVKANCHPFRVGANGSAMVHNGVFPTRPRNEHWSDTREIAHVLNSWSEDIILRSINKFEEWHGTGNRTAMLMSGGEMLKTGSWCESDGIACSNLRWKWEPKTTTSYRSSRNDVDGEYYEYIASTYDMGGHYKSRQQQDSTPKSSNFPELKKCRGGKNEFVNVGGSWVSREKLMELAEKEEGKKTDSEIPVFQGNSSVDSAENNTKESPPKTDSVQSASSNTEMIQIPGKNGDTTHQFQEFRNEVLRSHIVNNHSDVVIRVHTRPDKSGNQAYFVYFWDICNKGVRCEKKNSELQDEIDFWLSLNRAVQVTECFSGMQRVIREKKTNHETKVGTQGS